MSRIACIIVLCVLLSDASKPYDGPKYKQQEIDYDEWKLTKEPHEDNVEFQPRSIGFDNERAVFSGKHYIKSVKNLPPALKARYVVNRADWAAVATISMRKDVQGFPVANLISIADGPVGNGTGIPYMYLTPLDYTAQDLAKDHRATLLVTLAQGNYCKDKAYDPMDPRCVRVMLTGKIVAVKNETEEYDIAKTLFFDRHPKLQNMPASHNFFFAELKISAIAMLDTFGGPKYISVEDYFNPLVNFPRRKRMMFGFPSTNFDKHFSSTSFDKYSIQRF
ncbi:protein CREG1 [Pogonomyrmex barbatus]|uniref:Protein CREG1 n=1 Tax=Pogonomyrmex barbatus TaxID=144034 RepID=A0A6I9WBN0_9HYME|nr:protein CREG1 [Pogonomyrmex barbatus]